MLPFVMTRTVKVGAQENYLNGGCADVFDLNFCPSPPIDVKRTKPEQKPFLLPLHKVKYQQPATSSRERRKL